MLLIGPWMKIASEFIKVGPYITLTRARGMADKLEKWVSLQTGANLSIYNLVRS